MADIQLPGYNFTQAGGPMPSVDPGAAAAPWKGLASIGNAVEGIGDHMLQKQAETEAKIKEASNLKTMSDMTLDATQRISEFRAEKIKNPGNPDKWLEEYKAAMDPVQQKWTSDPNMPAAQRLQLTAHLNNIMASEANNLRVDGATASYQHARLASDNVTEEGIRTLNPALVEQGKASIRSMVPAAEADKYDAATDRKFGLSSIDAQIAADPLAWKDRVTNPDELVKDFKISQADVPAIQSRQKSAEIDRTNQRIDQMNDRLVTDPNLRPEDIDRNFPDLRPAVREIGKQRLRSRDDLAVKAQYASPEWEKHVVGEVTASAMNWSPAVNSSYDADYAKMKDMVNTLPESSGSRSSLLEMLGRMKTGQAEQIKTQVDLGRQTITDEFKAGKLGDISASGMAEDRTVAATHFLGDNTLLHNFGFSQESQDKIVAAYAESPAKAEQVFREEFPKRSGEVGTTPYVTAAFNAIRAGEPNFQWADPEAEDRAISAKSAARAKLGDVLTSYDKWASTLPDAKPADVQQKVYELLGEHARQSLLDKKLPNSSKPLDPTTGAVDGAVPVGSNLIETVKSLEAGDAPEGFYRTAFPDYHQYSIGYGTKSKPGEVIDKPEAEKRLKDELSTHAKLVDDVASKNGYNFSPPQRDALTSFSFNTGKLDDLLVRNGHRNPEEITSAMRLYRNAGGQRLKGLEKRRETEVQLFNSGYPPVR